MRKKLLILTGLILALSSPELFASRLGINVIVAGEIQPGVYGEVELDNAPPPRVVYERPVVIYQERRYVTEEPIYLHVPPDHSSHWSRYCYEYNACGRRVYFVRSQEYEPEYRRYERERHYYDYHPRKEYRDDWREHHDDRHDREERHEHEDRHDHRHGDDDHDD